MTTIERVAVVGGGLMGSGIAEVCALASIDVILHEINDDAAAAALTRVEQSLHKAVVRNKLGSEEASDAISRITVSAGTDLTVMADRQLVIEAIVENEGIKKELFSTLDALVQPGTILATNTSSIPVTRIAASTSRPGSVVGMHFFNPAPVMPLVEIIRTPLVDDATIDAAAAFASGQLGKTVVHADDRAGFIVNTLLCTYILDAIRMYESGYATKEDIDAAMIGGASYPIGPLALCDLIGNDTLLAVAESLFEEFREVRYAPPPGLKRMVEAGMLGRKSGKGFYDYP